LAQNDDQRLGVPDTRARAAAQHRIDVREWRTWRARRPIARGSVSFSELGAALARAGYTHNLADGCTSVLAAFEAGRFSTEGASLVQLVDDDRPETVSPDDLEAARCSRSPDPMWGDPLRLRRDLLDMLYVPFDCARQWFAGNGWTWCVERLNWYGAQGGFVAEAPQDHLARKEQPIRPRTGNRQSVKARSPDGKVPTLPSLHRTGPRPEKRERASKQMLDDIQSGRCTRDQLRDMKHLALAGRYDVSRETARKALAIVLSELARIGPADNSDK
jgi:hypothetical protein